MSAPQERASTNAIDSFDLTGVIIGSKYRITGKLADGGMSRVFLADQLDLKRTVVVKVLMMPASLRSETERQMWKKRFQREAASLAGISHPNVIGVHEFGTTEDGLAYLVMEYAEGDTLASFVRQHGFLEPRVAVRIADQVASALLEAHSMGMIHRDLKPQNIVLLKNRTNRVKVLDFGLAKRLDESPDDPESTQGDTRLGSPRYMAPEQVSGDPVSPATDVYALGCVLYFMLTGRPPFTAATSMGVMLAHLQETPRPLEAVHPTCQASAALSQTVMRCLEKKPDARLVDMSEVHRALAACPELAAESSGSYSVERAAPPSMSVVPRADDSVHTSMVTAAFTRTRKFWAAMTLLAAGLALATWIASSAAGPADATAAAPLPNNVATPPATASGAGGHEASVAPANSPVAAANVPNEQAAANVQTATRTTASSESSATTPSTRDAQRTFVPRNRRPTPVRATPRARVQNTDNLDPWATE